MTTKNQIQTNAARGAWQPSITLIIGNGMSKEISHSFGLQHHVLTPADFVKQEQHKTYPSTGLHIFVMKNLSSVLRILYSCPSISTNPLSVLWCPQIDQPSTEDLMECAQKGIAFVPCFAKNQALSMSIIEGRLKATAVYRAEIPVGTPSIKEELDLRTSKHDRLAQQLRDYLDKHHHNEHLCIDQMGQDLGMSRTNFFNKIKSMTGASPSRFVMAFRLNKAKELLRSDDLTISDVAFKVGFSSTSYFAKCFKAFFHTTPTAFAQENNLRSLNEVESDFNVGQYLNQPLPIDRNIRNNFRTKLEHTYKKKEHS